MRAQLSSLPTAEVGRALRSPRGLRLRTGPVTAQIRSPIPYLGAAVAALYAHHEVVGDDEFVDFEFTIRQRLNPRRWLEPHVVFEIGERETFNPLPGDQGFPLLEWGLNWCVYSSCNHYLILHAAVLERGGRALILPAPSGSGKSTLCAGLLFNGWRLLSDELTLICPRHGDIVPIPRPVSVKNASIAVLSELVPGLRFGSRVDDTAKGTVAHFAPPPEAVRRAGERATAAWVVVPRYIAGHPATLTPVERARGFMTLVENAFNYDLYGAEGFELLASVIDRSTCFTIEYGDLARAIEVLNRLADAPGA